MLSVDTYDNLAHLIDGNRERNYCMHRALTDRCIFFSLFLLCVCVSLCLCVGGLVGLKSIIDEKSRQLGLTIVWSSVATL